MIKQDVFVCLFVLQAFTHPNVFVLKLEARSGFLQVLHANPNPRISVCILHDL